MKHISIRLAISGDAAAIHQLHTVSVRGLCSSHYTADIIDGWLKNRTPEGYGGIGKQEMYVAEHENQVVGFSHVVAGVIEAMFVHPDFCRKGIGTSLMQHALNVAGGTESRAIRLQATLNAQCFYEQFGFVKKSEELVSRNDIELTVITMERSGSQPGNEGD